MNSPNRRKACEAEIEKEAYLRHIHRLQELKSGKSAEQLRRNFEQKKLTYTLNTVRKFHASNRAYKLREMRQIEQETKDMDFHKVKSVVTNDFNWPIPIIAPKHKRNQKPILSQNLKIFQRIIKTKTKLCSQNEAYTQRKKKTPLPYISSSDFSKLYQTSQLNEDPKRTLKLKLGKSKKYHQIKLNFDFGELFEIVKDLDSMYLIEVGCQDGRVKSQGFILGELERIRVCLKIGDRYFGKVYGDGKEGKEGKEGKVVRVWGRLVKILDCFEKKEVCKVRFYVDIDRKSLLGEDKQNFELIEPNTKSNTQSPQKLLKQKAFTTNQDSSFLKPQLLKQTKEAFVILQKGP